MEMNMTETQILERIKSAYEDIMQDKLVGIYVHGSIAFECFRWENSDIDLLVIVNQTVTLQEKKLLIAFLLEIDGDCPPKGVEMSVVHEKYCNPFRYPTPFELHYSNAHRDACKSDLEKYCLSMHGEDKDLAAHFTVTYQAGIALCGKAIPEVFSVVPKEAYLNSIRCDIEGAVTEIEENPVYIILNLCRVLAYCRAEVVLSKKQGGEWALLNLPSRYHRIVRSALCAYTGDGAFHWQDQEICSMTYDSADKAACQMLRDFAAYMLEKIG